MNTITNDQIKEAFERPELLKELFPDAFALEAGKWYLIKEGKFTALFNFSGEFDERNNPLGYGIGFQKEWMELDGIGWGYATIRPATTEEIETALIAEAKKRGFKKGVNVNLTSICKLYAKSKPIVDEKFKLVDNDLSVDYFYIMKDGKWSEIIQETETEIELTLDEIAKKFGVDKVKIKK